MVYGWSPAPSVFFRYPCFLFCPRPVIPRATTWMPSPAAYACIHKWRELCKAVEGLAGQASRWMREKDASPSRVADMFKREQGSNRRGRKGWRPRGTSYQARRSCRRGGHP